VGRADRTHATQPTHSPHPTHSTRSALIDRRTFLAAALCAPAAGIARQLPGARLVATVPLGNPAGVSTAPLNRLLGSGLGARLFTDLSTVTPDGADAKTTPTDRFFIRTARPSSLPDPASWSIEVAGLVASPSRISLASLQSLPARSGRVVLECSGNTDPANYGLLSAADWDGVSMPAFIDRIRPRSGASRVLVSGVDDDADPLNTSVPGASWIFTRDDLERAILAHGMNGAPLPHHHGFPVRLIVPGWYGCACIKWVNRIELAPDEAPATPQMREFSSRTHQNGVPALAREFVPAVIDTAAMPVRIEKWVAGGRVFYRIIGLMWGGSTPTNALSMRFRVNTSWTRVEHCPMPATTDTWTVWTHTWRPPEPGRYDIVLRVDDPRIRTRRLDIFFYTRSVQIDEI
jgi:DMSO/TMAO reductase YedYZ molybdopterin-dependent catalytic subunit